MTALEPRREERAPADHLDHAVVVALGLAAVALAVAGFTSQRLGVPAALWVAAGGAVPLSFGMLLILHERGRRVREGERVRRRETAAVLAEKLSEARQRADELETPIVSGDDVGPVAYPADPDAADGPGVIERVEQLEGSVVDLNRQVDDLQRVIKGVGAGKGRRARHSGPSETPVHSAYDVEERA